MTAVVAALTAVACTEPAAPPVTRRSPARSAPPSPVAGPNDPLCRLPPLAPRPTVARRPLPKAIAEVADEVEEVRGVEFTRPITVDPVDQAEIGGLLKRALDRSYPQEMMDRRARAWSTIGLIPRGTDLRKALGDFAGSQIVGFYDTQTHQLVFSGSASPTPHERVTLSHELTHALDDQRFNLSRLDELEGACQDEQLAALIALAEGDAVTMSLRWASANLSPEELTQWNQEASSFPPPPPSVPEFVIDLFIAPYQVGPVFVESLLSEGGIPALNRAFRNPPVTTEQVLHPERYRRDRPTDVDVAEIAEKLGGPWEPLDVYQVGELWLRVALDLRLSDEEAESAAAGWDGGEYRAWSDGDDVAVLLQTVWDSAGDASQFADSMRRWIDDEVAAVERRGTFVQVLFGTSRRVVRDLESATA
ncbi:MAG: hypothetical protein ABR518_08105 [Actinomycetota bacterium]